MSQCPKCHAEVAADARFCGECGTAMPADQPQSPAAAGKTVVLPAAVPPTARLSEDAPAPDQPQSPPVEPGKTVVLPAATPPTARLSDEPAASNEWPNVPPPLPPGASGDAKTIMAGLPAAAPPPGPNAPPPTAAYPAASPEAWSQPAVTPSGGQVYPARSPLDAPPVQAAPKSGGKNQLLLILGLGAGLCVVMAILVFGALSLLGSRVSSTPTQVSLRTPQPVGAAATPASAGDTGVADAFGDILLRDSFDNPARSSLSDGETDEASYAFSDGVYTINLRKEKYIVWSTFKGTYDDAALEVDATVDGPTESAIGLMFRYQDEKNFYMFLVSGDGRYSLDMYVDDELTTLIDWTEAPEINTSGESNHLRVETEGDTIRLFVNDQLLDEVSDDTFTEGEMALAINTFDEGDATATFDNLIVRGKE